MKKGIREIAELCYANGIKKIVLSPGSRCAPLTIAFTEHAHLQCYQIIDERSAAFFALGLSLGSHEPVALICTSGSAVLNYGPALAEAFYSDVPLIALTADRPAYKIGHQDGQAINQVNVFQNFVHHSLNLNADFESDEHMWQAHTQFKNALKDLNKGPVHVNFQFDEPLYQIADVHPEFKAEKVLFQIANQEKALPDLSGKKIMIIAGQTEGSVELNKLIETFEKYNQVVVVGEAISNINAKGFIRNPNEIIRHSSVEERNALLPDIVFTFGKGIVSKIFKTWLINSDIAHYHIDLQGREINTYKSFKDVFTEDVLHFLARLKSELKEEISNYKQIWNAKYQEQKEKFLQNVEVEFSDVLAYKTCLNQLSSQSVLHAANSMSVRYVNFLESFIPEQIQVFVNRGVSGIDGSSSTALGISVTNDKENWILTGDLAFQYDVNAFWNKYVHERVKVVVFNNSGGGIFRMIDGPQSRANLLPHFETPIESDAKGIALRSKMNYFRASNLEELRVGLEELKKSEKAGILEVFTNPEVNEKVYKNWISKL